MSNIVVVTQASAFPQAGWIALQSNQAQANPILPTLLKCFKKERHNVPTRNHLWAVMFSRRNPNQVHFILSITDSIISTYPVFLFTTIPDQFQTHNEIIPSMRSLVQELHMHGVPHKRVYSVFGPMVVAESFGHAWTELTGIPVIDTYYDSWLATITPGTFVSGRALSYDTPDFQFRIANENDIPHVARLCFEFAATSPPFEISKEDAFHEAKYLVEGGLVWVCCARLEGKWQAVSLVAYTRNTDTAATITKVFTLEHARRKGICPKLMSTVCRYLFSQGKHEISLFVGVENRASSVYERLGFPVPRIPENGVLGPTGSDTNGAERWIELGFQRDHVNLGKW